MLQGWKFTCLHETDDYDENWRSRESKWNVSSPIVSRIVVVVYFHNVRLYLLRFFNNSEKLLPRISLNVANREGKEIVPSSQSF